MKLTYMKATDPLIGYSDANWARDIDNRHSVSGNVFLLGGGAVSWTSKRQTVVATSTAEAEYIALYHCAQEAVVMRELLSELDGAYRDKPLVIMCDSQSAIAISKNNSRKSRAKHIDIRYHFVKERVEAGDVTPMFC